MVRCVKRCLRKVLGTAKLSQDEFSTVLTEIERTLNSSSNFDFVEDHEKLIKRFFYLTNRLSNFWNRWRKEYITDLREFHKESSNNSVSVAKGDLVLIQEDNVNQGLWKMGVIESLIIGRMVGHMEQLWVSLVRVRLELLQDHCKNLFP